MRPQFPLFGVSVAAAFSMALVGPSLAQTQAEAQTAAAVAIPPLALPTQTAEAVKAAQAAQAGPGARTTPTDVAEAVAASPDGQAQARVVASTAAAPLTSPDFDPGETREGPPTVALGDNTVAGKVSVDNTPPAGGLLRANPSLLGGPTRSDVGVSAQF